MKQRIVLIMVGVVLVLGLLQASCSKPVVEKQYVVGIVNPNLGTKEIQAGFIKGLAANGYVEGKNLTLLQCCGKEVDMAGDIKEMVARKVDLLFTVTTPATKLAKQETAGTDIPVVFSMNDPISSGIIESLASTGGNITGVQIRGSVPKALEWLLAFFPGVKNIWVPITFDTKAAQQSLADFETAAESVGVRVTVAEIKTESELDAALAAIPAEADAVFLLHSIFVSSHAAGIVKAANARNLPTAGAIDQSKDGVIVSYSPKLSQIGRQASRLAHLVFQGQPAAHIPAEVAEFFLEINLQSAQQAGLEIPGDMLLLADNILR